MFLIDQAGRRIRYYCRQHRTLSEAQCQRCSDEAQRKAESFRRLEAMFARHPEMRNRGRKEAV